MTDEYISGVEVGDVLEVYLAGNNDVSITIKITGILPYYSQLPSLSAQASEYAYRVFVQCKRCPVGTK